MRIAMVRPGRERLSGTVQVDETFIGGAQPGKRGRGSAGKVLVMIAVEVNDSKIGRIRLHRLKDASSESLNSALAESVEPGSIIETDGWAGYSKVNDIGLRQVIARKVSNVGEDLLPKAHRVKQMLLLRTHRFRFFVNF